MDTQAPEKYMVQPKVFLSHSSLDKEAVWPIVNALVGYAAVPWVDALEMRPGDQLFRRISTAIEGTAYLLVIVSPNSVNSKWVQEEVRQAASAEFYDNRIRVIPCTLGGVEMPPYLRDRLYCDFSVGVFRGVAQVLRGIHRDRHVIEVQLDHSSPLRLDDRLARHEVSRVLGLTHGIQRFFFVINASAVLDEIAAAWAAAPVKGDALDPFVLDYSRARAALPFVVPNLSCLLSRVADVAVDTWGRDAGLTDLLLSVMQRTVTLTLYRFWSGVVKASEPGLVERLKYVDGSAVIRELAVIDAIRDPGRHPTRSAEAHVFGCEVADLMDLGLQGSGTVFDSRVDVPAQALQEDTRSKYLGLHPLDPDSEILNHEWVRYFVPAIASRHTLDCSFSGQYAGHFLERIGLRKADYQHFGYS